MSLRLEELVASGQITREDVVSTALGFIADIGEPSPSASRRQILTRMEVQTRRPESWVLVDKETGRSYVWRNGWVAEGKARASRSRAS